MNANGLYAAKLATVKFRYKEPNGTTSRLIEQTIMNSPEMIESNDFKFAQAVIEFGLIMRGSQYAGNSNFDAVLKRANEAIGEDKFGYRREFIILVEKAKLLSDPLLE
jgi:Ca-activated chloride channel family protein